MNTIVELIRNLAGAPRDRAVHLHKPAPDETLVVPYPELYRSIQAHMAGLRAQGIGPGARVILPFETDERVLCTFLALIGVGALPLSVKPYLFSGKEGYIEFLQEMVRRFRVSRILRTDSLRGLDLPAPELDLATLAAPTSVEVPFHEPRPDTPAFVQFSSGTTAFPKGVPIRHDRFLANMGLINGYDHRRPEDVSSSWLPLYHDMGLIGGLLTSFVLPNTAHLYTPVQYLMDPIGWLKELGRHRVDGTVMPNFGVDYALRYLREADPDDLSELDFSSLRIIYLGSEPINMDTLDEFCRRMAPYGLKRSVFQPCYGMAEVVLMVTADGENNPKARMLPGGVPAVCVGKPLPTFDLRIVTDDGRVAGEGELGEIELGGGTLADGYFEEGRPLVGENGFYATGDVGMLVDGALYITGRIGDRMKVNGQSYFASAFEQVVDALPFVRTGRSAVFQVGERVIVLAEVQGVQALRAHRQHQEKVVDAVLQRTGVKVHPEDVHFIRYGQIHKTSSGKLRRQAVAEAHQRGQIRDTDIPGYLLDRARMRVTRVVQTLTLGLRASIRGLRGTK